MKIDKEKAITVAAIAAGLGALLILQKITTPHRRQRPPPNTSGNAGSGPLVHPHAAVTPPGSSLHPPPAPRRSASRGGSRPRSGVNDSASRSRSRSQSHLNPSAPPEAHNGKKPSRAPSHAVRQQPTAQRRDRGQKRAHSHVSHTVGARVDTPAGGASPNAVAPPTVSATPPAPPPEELAPPRATDTAPLTVKMLSEHYQREGTLSSVRDRLSGPDPDAHREFPASSSPPRDPRPSQRSPSNVATVGSKSLEGDAAAAVLAAAGLQLSFPLAEAQREHVAGREREQPPKTSRGKRPHHDRSAAAATAPARAEVAVQTEAAWFTEGRATQTDAPALHVTDTLTPFKWRGGDGELTVAGPNGEFVHVTAAVDDASDPELSPINHQDATEGFDSSSPTPLHRTAEVADVAAKASKASDSSASAQAAGQDGKPFIPRYLLLDAERQLNSIIAALYTTAPHNATSWMVLYCYLKELPRAVLQLLHERERLAPLPDPEVERSGNGAHVVEGQGDLEKEVRELLGLTESAVSNTTYYFKWKGSKVVRREGDYREALAKKLGEQEAKKQQPSVTNERFAHLVVRDDEDDVPREHKLHRGGADEDAAYELSDADRLATVVKRYAFVLLQGAATQTEGSDQPSNGLSSRGSPDSEGRTSEGESSAAAALLQSTQVRRLLQQLASLRANGGSSSDVYPADFITAAREAQRLLDSCRLVEDGSSAHRMPSMPGDAHDPQGSRDPRSSAQHSDAAHVAPSPSKSSPSKPSKPSIQVAAFRRGTSSANALGHHSPRKADAAAATSARSSTSDAKLQRRLSDNVFERLYTPPTRAQNQ